MSLGAAPTNGGEVSPLNGDGASDAVPPTAVVDDQRKKAVDAVYNSEIGVNTLLNRLKQSIASAKVG